jgi:hypothetical protein
MYVNSTSNLPGMTEVIEYTEQQKGVYAGMYRAAVSWRGPEEVSVAHG